MGRFRRHASNAPEQKAYRFQLEIPDSTTAVTLMRPEGNLELAYLSLNTNAN